VLGVFGVGCVLGVFGVFVILDKNKDPYVITKALSKEEADYFIKGIAHIAADIPGYNYVIDVTP